MEQDIEADHYYIHFGELEPLRQEKRLESRLLLTSDRLTPCKRHQLNSFLINRNVHYQDARVVPIKESRRGTHHRLVW